MFCGQLQTVTEDIFFYFRSTSVFSALEVCYENALYKFTFDIDIDIDIDIVREGSSKL